MIGSALQVESVERSCNIHIRSITLHPIEDELLFIAFGSGSGMQRRTHNSVGMRDVFLASRNRDFHQGRLHATQETNPTRPPIDWAGFMPFPTKPDASLYDSLYKGQVDQPDTKEPLCRLRRLRVPCVESRIVGLAFMKRARMATNTAKTAIAEG